MTISQGEMIVNIRIRTLVGCLVAAIVTDASAIYLVDTGTPAPGPYPTGGPYWVLYEKQYFAGRFTVSNQETITEAEGYMQAMLHTGSVAVSLHTDGGNVPGSIILTQSFLLQGDRPLGWYGLSNLNWTINPGVYWISFYPDSVFEGMMPGKAPNPMSSYAIAGGNTPYNWRDHGPHAYDYLAVGVRVTAIPEVPAGILLPLGLVLLGIFSKRSNLHRQA